MTIAAGFVCDDGVVLCADTELTSTYKQQGQKLWLHEKANLSVAVSGAGDYTLLKLANDAIRDRLSGNMSGNRVLHSVIEPVIRSIHEDHIDRAPDWRVLQGYDLALLVAVKTRRIGVQLYETSRTGVAEVRDYRCVGAGSPVANYIAGTMFSPSLSSFWCQAFAAYLIQQTKAYGLDCGGGSSVVVIRKDGPSVLLPTAKLPQMEKVGNRVHDALGPILFSAATDWAGPDFDAKVRAFQDAVEKSRSDMFREMAEFWRTPAARQFFQQERGREAKQVQKPPKRGRKGQPPSPE